MWFEGVFGVWGGRISIFTVIFPSMIMNACYFAVSFSNPIYFAVSLGRFPKKGSLSVLAVAK